MSMSLITWIFKMSFLFQGWATSRRKHGLWAIWSHVFRHGTHTPSFCRRCRNFIPFTYFLSPTIKIAVKQTPKMLVDGSTAGRCWPARLSINHEKCPWTKWHHKIVCIKFMFSNYLMNPFSSFFSTCDTQDLRRFTRKVNVHIMPHKQDCRMLKLQLALCPL